MKLAGKVAIVTGAASGMGRAIAITYAKEGAKVVLADFNFDGLVEVIKEITDAGGEATAVRVDVSQLADVESMVDTAVKEYGTLDILVNNAGIMDGMEPVGEISEEKWDKVFAVNTKGVMRAMHKAMPIFLEKDSGVIINVISTGGLNGGHAGAAYVASKHAIVGLTKNSAFMYGNTGIRINGLAPGGVETNIGASMTSLSEAGFARQKLACATMPRLGKSEEIAKVALFLASDDASFVNGSIIVADGGWTAAN